MKVSQSKVKLWRRCRFAYSAKYVDNLRKKVKSRPLQFGTIIHKMIECHANGDDPFAELDQIALKDKKLFDAEHELYGDIIRDVRFIMMDYFRFWHNKDLSYIRHQGQNAEHAFEVEIAPDLVLTGKIDAFARFKKQKLRFLVEHKSFKRKPSEDMRWRNLQSAIYLKACQLLGWGKFDGIIWDYIGSKPPGEPELLKNGTMSRRRIITLPSALRDFLQRNNLSAEHYKEYVTLVEENQSDYFERYTSPIKPTLVDLIFSEFRETALQIQELHGKDRTRNIDLHCSYCEYEPLCRAELLGLDVDYVRKADYYVDEKEDKVVESAD